MVALEVPTVHNLTYALLEFFLALLESDFSNRSSPRYRSQISQYTASFSTLEST
jgi:hypothetical protein